MSQLTFGEVDAYVPPLARTEEIDWEKESLRNEVARQREIIGSLRRELNEITAPGRCCRCGDYAVPDTEEHVEGQAPKRPRRRGAVTPRSARAEAERQAAAAIDRLPIDELQALIARAFDDRPDLRVRCFAALRDGGRSALVFFRPALLKAMAEPSPLTPHPAALTPRMAGPEASP